MIKYSIEKTNQPNNVHNNHVVVINEEPKPKLSMWNLLAEEEYQHQDASVKLTIDQVNNGRIITQQPQKAFGTSQLNLNKHIGYGQLRRLKTYRNLPGILAIDEYMGELGVEKQKEFRQILNTSKGSAVENLKSYIASDKLLDLEKNGLDAANYTQTYSEQKKFDSAEIKDILIELLENSDLNKYFKYLDRERKYVSMEFHSNGIQIHDDIAHSSETLI